MAAMKMNATVWNRKGRLPPNPGLPDGIFSVQRKFVDPKTRRPKVCRPTRYIRQIFVDPKNLSNSLFWVRS
jgi:hypothetical protein